MLHGTEALSSMETLRGDSFRLSTEHTKRMACTNAACRDWEPAHAKQYSLSPMSFDASVGTSAVFINQAFLQKVSLT